MQRDIWIKVTYEIDAVDLNGNILIFNKKLDII